jgi:hypothetical protein
MSWPASSHQPDPLPYSASLLGQSVVIMLQAEPAELTKTGTVQSRLMSAHPYMSRNCQVHQSDYNGYNLLNGVDYATQYDQQLFYIQMEIATVILFLVFFRLLAQSYHGRRYCKH